MRTGRPVPRKWPQCSFLSPLPIAISTRYSRLRPRERRGFRMSAQDLSFAELGDVTRAWTLEPVFTFLNTHPVSAPFMEEFLELRTLVTSARAEDSALAEITDELGR